MNITDMLHIIARSVLKVSPICSSKEILKKYCSTRKQLNRSSNSFGKGLDRDGLGDEVVVGGATFFVLNVEEFEKL